MPELKKENALFLGSNEITIHKAREFIILLVALGLLTWYSVNLPDFFDIAKTWLLLGVFAAIAVAFSFIIKRIGNFDYNVPIAGRGILPIPKKYILVFAIVLLLVSFFVVGKSQYAILAPKFELVECGTFCNAFVSIPAAIIEDFIFFSVIYGAIFSLVLLFTRNLWLALILATLLNPFIFLFYHTLKYGASDVVNSVNVFIFGLEQTLIVLLLRDLILVHARHVGNNVAQEIFTQMTLSGFFVALLNSIFFWVVLILLIIGIVLWIKFLRKRNVPPSN